MAGAEASGGQRILVAKMSNVTPIAISECGDAFIISDITEPVARLIISRGAELNVGIDVWDDETQVYPIRISFGKSGQLSVSLLPEDAVVLVERLQQVLEYGL